MKLQFIEPYTEYANGEYHRKNDGKPFDVDKRFADTLIKTGVFEPYAEPKEPRPAAATKKKSKENK